MKTKTTKEQINEPKSWFFAKINKIHKTLARIIRKSEEWPN